MRWDYPPLDINPVFPGLGDIIIIITIIIIIIIIIAIIIIPSCHGRRSRLMALRSKMIPWR